MYQPVPADALTPQLWPVRGNEFSLRVSLRLSTAPHHYLVRLTGGCGNLDERLVDSMYTMFVDAFDGFEGALLFGGTRMLRTSDTRHVRHGITEVVPLIRRYNPACKVLGVAPLAAPPVELDFELGTIISREPEYITIVHPGQDICLLLQASADDGVIWEAEYKYCLRFIEAMREDAGFQSLLVSYNGGNTTEKEILETARRGLPVLLIDGSEGKTQAYARDEAFLARHPNVHVCEASTRSLRQALEILGVQPALPGGKVIPLSARRKELA